MPRRFSSWIMAFSLIASCALASDAVKVDSAPSASPPALEQNSAPLNPSEKKGLISQFKKTLVDEEKSLDREQRVALRDFTGAQSQEIKDWRNQEKHKRRIFFDQHTSGPERRDYVQAYISRKKQFDQKQRDDVANFKVALREKKDVFKTSQKNRDLQFKAIIDRNERPPSALWKR